MIRQLIVFHTDTFLNHHVVVFYFGTVISRIGGVQIGVQVVFDLIDDGFELIVTVDLVIWKPALL